MGTVNVLRDGVMIQVAEEEIRPPLTPEQIEELRPYKTLSDAQLALSGWINSLTGQIKDVYPDVVQQGWEEEEAMAEAFFLDAMTPDQTDTLARDAAAKDRTPGEHAQRILENAQMFRMIKDLTRTLWLKTDRLLTETNDPDNYPIILAAAIEEAKPLAQQFGLMVE